MHQLYSMDFTQGFQYGPTWPIFGTSMVEGAFDNQASCVPSSFCTLGFPDLRQVSNLLLFLLLSNHYTATLLLVLNLTSVSQTRAISARTSHLASSIDNNAGISHPIPAWCLQLAMAIPLNCIQHATNLGSRLPPQSRRRRRVIRLICFNEIHFHIAGIASIAA